MHMRDIIRIVETESVIPELGLTPEHLVKWFTEGACYSLAIEHHRRYAWPMYVIGHGDLDEPNFECFHAFVQHPIGIALDINGPQESDAILDVYLMPDDIAKGWEAIPVTPLVLSRVLTRYPKRDDLEYAGRVIDYYLKPRYPKFYPTLNTETKRIT